MTYSPHINPEKEESPALRKLLDIRAVQLLLAGMYFLLGRVLGRGERAAYREQALRMRRAVTETRLNEYRKARCKAGIARWSGDERLHWNKRMWTVWQYNKANHPPKYRRIGGCIEKFAEYISELSQATLQAFANLRDNLRVPAPP